MIDGRVRFAERPGSSRGSSANYVGTNVYRVSMTKSTVTEGMAVSDAGAHAHHDGHELSAFFAVGIVINLILFAAFLVWAISQWKRK